MRVILLLAVLAVPAAHAASVKPMTALHSQMVKLNDLFSDAGPDADKVLGPGPRPGGQIVVESAQLAYIARRYGVDWRPGSGPERAVLERAGRPLTEAEVMKALRGALTEAGASADAEVQTANFTPPMVPVEGEFSADVTGVQLDTVSHRFAAILTISGKTLDPVSVPLAGKVEETRMVPVAVSRLAAGTILRRDDLKLASVRVSQITSEVAARIEDAIGLEVRSSLVAGQTVPRADLVAPLLVKRGERVSMRFDGPGLSLTAEGTALEAGAMGDRVRVQNTASRAVVEAEVTGQRMVKVDPTRPPLTQAAAQRVGLIAR